MFCLECHDEVEAKAIASVDVAAYFSHPPKLPDASDLDDCSRAARSHRLRWFGDEDRDDASGRRVRQEFFDEGTVKSAYALCLIYAGRGNLPLSKFQEMIDRADRLDIWSYAGMEVWCIPQVLLLLADFGVDTELPCHFALVRTSKLSAIWRQSGPVSIKKLFSDTGNEARTIAGQPNPRPISRSDAADVSTSWIPAGLAAGLVACSRRQRDWRSRKR
ncbi:hypothetical protein [Sphingomonas sp. PP-CC-3G-468]|uniref:hypothetical protein n=1 Tax=Sphingomonas sp. PP-CC-3G-468 TaxID=2135656 RepID=UPI0014045E79|nr:hypothetical protein [Sphingomonas sp. PP-CC-3G-468]